MGKGTTVFYHSIYTSIEVLTDDITRLDAAMGAVIRYAVKSEEYTGDDPVVKCAMLQAIPLIEADRAKTNKGGHGAPKGNQNARKQTIGQEKTNDRLEENKPMVSKKQTYAEDGDGDGDGDGRRLTKTKTKTGDEDCFDGTKPQKRFVPPTIEEVRAYMQEYIKDKAENEHKYLNIGDSDPELFIAHHSAGGWVLKNHQIMKDWRQAVRTWILNHNKWTPDHLEERKHTLLQDDTDFGRFNRWLLREVPYVAGHFDTLLNEHQFTALKRAYGTERLTDILYDLENRHDWCDKCSDLNTTLINWLHKDDGK